MFLFSWTEATIHRNPVPKTLKQELCCDSEKVLKGVVSGIQGLYELNQWRRRSEILERGLSLVHGTLKINHVYYHFHDPSSCLDVNKGIHKLCSSNFPCVHFSKQSLGVECWVCPALLCLGSRRGGKETPSSNRRFQFPTSKAG